MNVLPAQFDVLRRALNFTTLSQRAAGQNIANVNTPGYKSIEVQFDTSAASLLEVDGKDQPYELATTDDVAIRNDGNNVDMDRELGRLNKAAMLFRVYSQLLSQRLSQMRSAIQVN